MQFKYFSEARLGAGGRLSVAVTARDIVIVHSTGKELESCPLLTPGYKYRGLAEQIGSGSGGARTMVQTVQLMMFSLCLSVSV